MNVSGTVSVDSGASITLLTVNNQNAAYSNGTFTKGNLQLSYGENQTITARVTDSRGYTTTSTVIVHYDPMINSIDRGMILVKEP